MGFDPRMAKIALQRHQGNVEKAVEELVICGGVIDGERCTDGKLCVHLCIILPLYIIITFTVYLFIYFLKYDLLLIIDSDDSGECEQVDLKNKEEEKADAGVKSSTEEETREKERLAYQRLADGMSTEEHDHLDLTLELEERFLREYQTLLTNP
jgi:hypothetical protein